MVQTELRYSNGSLKYRIELMQNNKNFITLAEEAYFEAQRKINQIPGDCFKFQLIRDVSSTSFSSFFYNLFSANVELVDLLENNPTV